MNMPWPKDNYIVRIAEAKFGASKRTENPMITLDLEVVSPETVTIGSESVTVAGTPLKMYLVTAVNNDEEKTKNWQAKIKAFFTKLKLPADNIDWNNPDLSVLTGINMWVLLAAQANEKRKDPTAEQKAANQLGDVLVDPITGVKQVTYYPNVDGGVDGVYGVAVI